MPRDGSGSYSLPNGSLATTGLTATASQHNTPIQDLEAENNVDRPIVAGGTGASTASGARTNLGLAIGSDVQAYNANLASLSGLTLAADRGLYSTAANTLALFTLTSAGRALLDDASASAQRTTLGLGTAATLNVGTGNNNVVQLDGSGNLPAVPGGNLTGVAKPLDFEDEQATTSGFAWSFTSLPAGLTEIEVYLLGVSLTDTTDLLIQLGDSGGIEESGYDAYASVSGASATASNGFILNRAAAGDAHRGIYTLRMIGSNKWIGSWSGVLPGLSAAGGEKTLSGELTQLRLTRDGGSATGDAGSIAIGYR